MFPELITLCHGVTSISPSLGDVMVFTLIFSLHVPWWQGRYVGGLRITRQSFPWRPVTLCMHWTTRDCRPFPHDEEHWEKQQKANVISVLVLTRTDRMTYWIFFNISTSCWICRWVFSWSTSIDRPAWVRTCHFTLGVFGSIPIQQLCCFKGKFRKPSLPCSKCNYSCHSLCCTLCSFIVWIVQLTTTGSTANCPSGIIKISWALKLNYIK